MAKRLFLYLFNTEVSNAIRECRCVSSDLDSWMDDENIPWNHSFRLDRIGIRVARLQYDFALAKRGYASYNKHSLRNDARMDISSHLYRNNRSNQ